MRLGRHGALAAGPPATAVRPVSTRANGSTAELPARPKEQVRRRLGLFAPTLLAVSVGIFLVAAADALSRSTRPGAQPLFWLGLVLVFAPIVLRLLAAQTGRNERIALVLLLGAALYLVKVFRDPFELTFADELVHLQNVNSILSSGSLFERNPLLPVTSSYPGLESLTAAFASLSGLSVFGAALVVVGVARLLTVLGLFLLFERVSGSARVAGVAVVVYASNPNFVFFDAQFSYETLALPLVFLGLLGYVEWRRGGERSGWTVAVLLTTAAVVATHHLSAYALCVVFLALVLVVLLRFRDRRWEAPVLFTAFSVAAAAAWAGLVARSTYGYLRPVVAQAMTSSVDTVLGHQEARRPFSGGGAQATPLPERVVAILAVLLLVIAVLVGVRLLWRRYRADPFALLLGAAALATLVVFALRAVPSAWETANRSGEYLYVGAGLVVALAAVSLAARGRGGAALAAAVLTVLFAGGLIMGWRSDQRLAAPYRVVAGSGVIQPEGRVLADWVREEIGPGRRFAATESDARLLVAHAGAVALAGVNPDVRDILRTETLDPWQRRVLRENRLRYVVVDRRLRSFDNIAGYFFGLTTAGKRDELEPPAVATKFDAAGISRIYESGTISVYDRGAPRP